MTEKHIATNSHIDIPVLAVFRKFVTMDLQLNYLVCNEFPLAHWQSICSTNQKVAHVGLTPVETNWSSFSPSLPLSFNEQHISNSNNLELAKRKCCGSLSDVVLTNLKWPVNKTRCELYGRHAQGNIS